MPLDKHQHTTLPPTLTTTESPTAQEVVQQGFHQQLRAHIRAAVQVVMEEIMREELTQFLGAQWGESTPARKGYRNGSYTRDLATASGQIQNLKVPRDREGAFHTQLFDRYQRYEEQVAEGLTQMFVSGTSTHKVGEVAQTLMGVTPSGSRVSRLNHSLTEQFEAWRCRPLLTRLSRALSRWHLPGSASWRPGRPDHHFSGDGRRSGRQQRRACHPGVRPRKSRGLAVCLARPTHTRSQRSGSDRDRRT